jgi:cytochrome c biogenesis protein CcmG, thiol:disulfide interchange protein DsbE
MRKRLLYLIPVFVFVLLGMALAYGLGRDPGVLPSALLDREVPGFELPDIEGRDGSGLASGDLRDGVTVVNVWASWCVPCRAEHPMIEALAERVPVHGINHKDQPSNALAFLDELGDPFTRIGADRRGRVSIDWGVYGVPETFVVKDGRIVHKHVGPIMQRDLDETLLPLIENLQ